MARQVAKVSATLHGSSLALTSHVILLQQDREVVVRASSCCFAYRGCYSTTLGG